MSEVIPKAAIATIIAERVHQIHSQIPPQVKLVAISKYTTTAAIRAAYAAGVRDFGESRVQDAKLIIAPFPAHIRNGEPFFFVSSSQIPLPTAL